VTESLKGPSPAWLAFYALTRDEPIDNALEYLGSAHKRVWSALCAAREPDGQTRLPPGAVKELVDLQLFLIGLAQVADPNQKTPVNLKFVRRPGRPNRSMHLIRRYQRAGREVLRLKPKGYDGAVTEVAKATGLDRKEIEAWASSLERHEAVIAVGKIAAFFAAPRLVQVKGRRKK
jgi:hypothetical protein